MSPKSKKKFLGKSVLHAATERIELLFEHFPKVCVSFSGGKDSTVLLHLTMEVARRLRRTPVHVLVIDLEGQYKSTIDHIEEVFEHYGNDVHPWWICLPLNLRNACSAFHPYWCCWEPGREEDWSRPLPKHPSVISDVEYFPFFHPRMEFEQFVPAFQEWLAGGQPMASLVGIRSDESLNRYKAVKKTASVKKCAWNSVQWTAKFRAKDSSVSAFPIYDWHFEDIWKYINEKKLPYNRLYDYMYLAGTPFSEMRICQPYGDDQRKGLDMFHKIEPETWTKLVQRVTGANWGALYARQKFLGYKGGLGKPPNFPTWKSYAEFLLSTMPETMRVVYDRRISVFFQWWSENGYPLDAVPDEGTPALENKKMQPSWRRVAVSILKMDMGKSLSFGYNAKDTSRLLEIQERYRDL